MSRKGFPESYDRRALTRFVADIKAGKDEVTAPVYSHLIYDIVPGERLTVRRPDILIVEGLNVLQPALPGKDGRTRVGLADYFDFSVYVDARTEDIERWYLNRFRKLRETAFQNPSSYFRKYTQVSEEEALDYARTHLAHHQQAQPAGERGPHPRPRDPRPPQGPGPQGAAALPAQAVTSDDADRVRGYRAAMLHLRLITPADRTDDVVRLIENDGRHHPSRRAARAPPATRPGDVVLCDVAREAGDELLGELRELGLDETGSIAVENIDLSLSAARRQGGGGGAGRGRGRGAVGAPDGRDPRGVDALRHLPRVPHPGHDDRGLRCGARQRDPDRRRDGGRPGVRPAGRALHGAGAARPAAGARAR